MSLRGRHIEVRGTVQGVGFRPWVWQLASREGISGSVRNDTIGVIIEAYADEHHLDRFIAGLQVDTPPAARVADISWHTIPYRRLSAFTIAESADSSVRRVTIPPDLAICDECLAELFDPSNRRFLYPFINCTNCGPRYSIVRGTPYDRAKTTMAKFAMCDDCRREYEDPADRRFHAQPNACWKCGPQVAATNSEGRPIESSEPVRFAARAIAAQLTVAVKGIGGFHLACDATSRTAVQRLRERKHREVKPLAVMVGTIAEVEDLAFVSDEDRRLLMSIERPIVLLERKPGARLAQELVGDNPLVGLFLPYTPLHHILLRECRRPLVMTSGNISEEPMVFENGEAIAALGSVADVFLMHDREIESRIDDSVVRMIDGRPTVFRRARGYVPRGVEIGRTFAEPLLAVGAQLKNTFCIAAESAAFLGPHIGDLDNLETMQAFEQAIDRMKEFTGVYPRTIAHDLHPDYLSTRYALEQPGIRTIGVQHHHAHVASVMAEHGLDETVVGIAYDGTGFGPDGTAWGGEILIADYERYRRFATFRPIALAGADQAIRQVWRIALALLDDAFDGNPPLDSIPLFGAVPHGSIETVRRMIAGSVYAPQARGVGRYFDALGAIGLGLAESRYEGEVAFRWNVAAAAEEKGRYPVSICEDVAPIEIDLRPLVRAAVEDLAGGRSAAIVSARFHNSIAAVTVDLARSAAATLGEPPVVLGGGCFQNARLAEGILSALRPALRVFMNHDFPPGDGGLALGQAFVADAVANAEAIDPALIATMEVPACV